jgi:hypothetical protein
MRLYTIIPYETFHIAGISIADLNLCRSKKQYYIKSDYNRLDCKKLDYKKLYCGYPYQNKSRYNKLDFAGQVTVN